MPLYGQARIRVHCKRQHTPGCVVDVAIVCPPVEECLSSVFAHRVVNLSRLNVMTDYTLGKYAGEQASQNINCIPMKTPHRSYLGAATLLVILENEGGRIGRKGS